VLISALVFGGVPENAIKRAFSEAEIWVSPQLLKEYKEVSIELEAEHKIARVQSRALLSGIASFVANAKVAIPKKRLFLCRDKADNMVLECCMAADANFLITGDKDLLEIDESTLKTEFLKLKVVSPRGFLSVIDKTS
jgi:putative PIN family toxin of toxin-antitoxin system